MNPDSELTTPSTAQRSVISLCLDCGWVESEGQRTEPHIGAIKVGAGRRFVQVCYASLTGDKHQGGRHAHHRGPDPAKDYDGPA